MKALILAAGYATRLYPLTKDQPKPLLKVADKPIAEYMLDLLARVRDIDQVYVVTNSKFAPHFTEWADSLESSETYPFPVTIIDDGTDTNETRLGAIADIQFVLDQHPIEDDLLVVAGDNIFTFDFNELIDFFKQKQTDTILVRREKNREKLCRSGVVELDQSQKLVGFEEKPQNPRSEYVCPAVYLYRAESLSLIRNYLAQGENPDAPGNFVAWLYRHKPVHAFIMNHTYFDVGTLESYHRVCEHFGFSCS